MQFSLRDGVCLAQGQLFGRAINVLGVHVAQPQPKPSQLKVPLCRFKNRLGRAGRWSEETAYFITNLARTKTRDTFEVFAPCCHHVPFFQDSFPHTRGIDSDCSQPHFRGPNSSSQSRWRTLPLSPSVTPSRN